VSRDAAPDGPLVDGRQFLVEIAFAAEDVPPERRDEVLGEERRRGRQLMRERKIERIWRIAGTSNSVSVWTAPSAGELDGWLRALPIWPWSSITVTELDEHPLEAESRVGRPPA
jgi:muconolactone delta-isomerase